jgi:hypothetical protein
MRCVVVLALAACASAPKPPVPTKPERAVPETVDPQTLIDELQLAVLESYRAVAADYAEAYQDTLAKDARVVLLDIRPGDVVIGADVTRALEVRHYFPESRVEVISQELEAYLAADGAAGWVHDHLSYRVGRDQRRAVLPLRSTAAYARREGRWLKVQEHVSYPQSKADILAAARAGKLDKPVAIPSGEIGAEQAEAAAVVRGGLNGAAPFAADALIIPPWSQEEKRGVAASVASSFGAGASVKDEGLFVDVSSTKTLAWVAGNLVVDVGGTPVRLRGTWVLERRGGAWLIVQAHVSAPIAQAGLEAAVFGD